MVQGADAERCKYVHRRYHHHERHPDRGGREFGTQLGANPGGAVNISNGGSLDLSGITTANSANTFGAKQFNIAGSGVGGTGEITNSGALAQQNALQNVALTADATIGGTGRWDFAAELLC